MEQHLCPLPKKNNGKNKTKLLLLVDHSISKTKQKNIFVPVQLHLLF